MGHWDTDDTAVKMKTILHSGCRGRNSFIPFIVDGDDSPNTFPLQTSEGDSYLVGSFHVLEIHSELRVSFTSLLGSWRVDGNGNDSRSTSRPIQCARQYWGLSSEQHLYSALNLNVKRCTRPIQMKFVSAQAHCTPYAMYICAARGSVG